MVYVKWTLMNKLFASVMETGQGNSAKVNLVSNRQLFVIHFILPVVFKEEEMDVNEFISCCLVKNDAGTNK